MLTLYKLPNGDFVDPTSVIAIIGHEQQKTGSTTISPYIQIIYRATPIMAQSMTVFCSDLSELIDLKNKIGNDVIAIQEELKEKFN